MRATWVACLSNRSGVELATDDGQWEDASEGYKGKGKRLRHKQTGKYRYVYDAGGARVLKKKEPPAKKQAAPAQERTWAEWAGDMVGSAADALEEASGGVFGGYRKPFDREAHEKKQQQAVDDAERVYNGAGSTKVKLQDILEVAERVHKLDKPRLLELAGRMGLRHVKARTSARKIAAEVVSFMVRRKGSFMRAMMIDREGEEYEKADHGQLDAKQRQRLAELSGNSGAVA